MTDDPRERIRTFLVEREKLEGYLLDLSHRDGGPKAARFLRHNFDSVTLRDALSHHGREGRLVASRQTPYGIVFAIENALMTPLQRYLDVRSVWEIRPTRPDIARLITVTFP